MAINLIQARSVVRTWMRSNGYDTTLYTDSIIDTAIADCGEELARDTILLQRTDALALTANSDDLPTVPAGFRPDRLMSAYLTGNNVQVLPGGYGDPFTVLGGTVGYCDPTTPQLELVPYQQLLSLIYSLRTPIPAGQSGTVTLFGGQPQKLAFESRTGAGKVFPCPNEAYTCQLVWNDLFVTSTWIPGMQGAWSNTVTYQVGDVVTKTGGVYQALTQSLNVAPASDTTKWLLLTAQAWSALTTYAVGDVVVSASIAYVANAISTNVIPPDGTKWTLLGAVTVAAVTLTAPTAVTFNLVDDYLRTLLTCGAPSKAQYNEPLGGFAKDAGEKWLAFVKKMASKGNLGDNVVQMAPTQRDDGGLYRAGWNNGGGW